MLSSLRVSYFSQLLSAYAMLFGVHCVAESLLSSSGELGTTG